MSFSLEAKFQQEEIALEQLNGSVRASPRRQQGGASLLAGVLVFVHIGLHQVRHLTGVHLTTLAVTHLRRQHSESQMHSQLWQILAAGRGKCLLGRGNKEKMGYFWISNCSPTDCWLNPCPADELAKCSCGTTRRHGTNISSSGFSTSCNYLHAWLTNLIRTAVSTSSISVKYFPSVWMLVLDAIRV